MQTKQRERTEVVLELVELVTRLEAAGRLVPAYEVELSTVADRLAHLLDELFALDAREVRLPAAAA